MNQTHLPPNGALKGCGHMAELTRNGSCGERMPKVAYTPVPLLAGHLRVTIKNLPVQDAFLGRWRCLS